MRQSDIDRLEGGIRKIREESRDDSLILLGSKGTRRVDEGSSFFECCESEGKELVLELCFFLYVLERPESIGLLIRERYAALSATWSIEKDTIECLIRSTIEVVSRIEFLSLHDRRSLEFRVVHEFIIADLVLFEGDYFSLIAHRHRDLRRLGSRSRTHIEDRFSRFWSEDEHREK
jgi:hypothetical protein